MAQARMAVRGFVLAGTVFLLAGVVPALRGGPLRVGFFTLGVAFLLIGAAIARRSDAGKGPPPG